MARRSPPFRVLFACVGNSARSQMAQGFAKALGGPGVEARSGGSKPLGYVLPEAVQAMQERGIDISGHPSQGFVGSSRVDLQACKLEYSIVSPK